METCVLCGEHDAIPEYFEDELSYYCPKYDRSVCASDGSLDNSIKSY